MKRSSSQATKQNIRTRKRARPNEEQLISTLKRGEQAASTRKPEQRLIRMSPQDDSYESCDPSEEEDDADTRNTRMSQVKIDVSRPFMINSQADRNDFVQDTRGPYLWSVPQRQHRQDSSLAYKRVMTIVKRYVLAFIYSSEGGPLSSVWPEQYRPWFNENMLKAWVEIATRLRCIEATVADEVALVPTCDQAKKVGSKLIFFGPLC